MKKGQKISTEMKNPKSKKEKALTKKILRTRNEFKEID
jgi:hypothetical protein